MTTYTAHEIETIGGTTLTPGTTYDWTTLALIGWTKGDGSGHEGYVLDAYFDRDGKYKGVDRNGIEPIVAVIDERI